MTEITVSRGEYLTSERPVGASARGDGPPCLIARTEDSASEGIGEVAI